MRNNNNAFPNNSTENMKRKGDKWGKSRVYADSTEKLRLKQLRNIKTNKRLWKEQRPKVKTLKVAKTLLGLDASPSNELKRKINRI